MINEIDKNMDKLRKQLNSKEFRESLQNLKDVDMNKIKDEMEKLKNETEKSGKELQIEIQKLKNESAKEDDAT
jgi:hypothetical protein